MVADNASACLNKGVGGLVSSLSATCDMQHALLHTSVETVAVTVVVSQLPTVVQSICVQKVDSGAV